MNLSAEVMPVPRDLSSSCGTCVRFHTEADFPEKTEEVEQIVRVEPQGYVGIYHAVVVLENPSVDKLSAAGFLFIL